MKLNSKTTGRRDKLEATKRKNEWGSQIRSHVLDDRRVKITELVVKPEIRIWCLMEDSMNFKAYLRWDGK